MNVADLFKYYSFGYNYYLLFHGKRDVNVELVIESIDDFLNFIEEHDLKVTKQAIKEELKDFKNNLTKLEQDEKIQKKDSDELSELIKSIDKTLDAELQLRESYMLTEKRLGLERLLNKVNELFAKEVYSKLPPIAKYDFSEAGKCIAFERPTAAAFHILRGTEGVLRCYYESIVKRNRLEKPMWGPMVTELRSRGESSKTILDNLDNIRVNFRNPAMHPKTKYNLDEAQDLFNLCCDCVNRMSKKIGRR